MVIAHNMSAMQTNRHLGINDKDRRKSAEKLGSGYKINRSADDAAGLQMSEKMRWQIRGLNKGATNAEDAMSFCQVADGALGEMQNVIHRAKELCIQAANDTNTESDREAIQAELDLISAHVEDICENTSFNNMEVFPQDPDKRDLWIQSGSLEASGVMVEKPLILPHSTTTPPVLTGLDLDSIDVSSHASASKGIETCHNALLLVTEQRAKMGSYVNRFEHTVNNNLNTSENTQAAESRIRDTNMADEMVAFSQANILSQVGTSLLTQANQSTAGVVQLLS